MLPNYAVHGPQRIQNQNKGVDRSQKVLPKSNAQKNLRCLVQNPRTQYKISQIWVELVGRARKVG